MDVKVGYYVSLESLISFSWLFGRLGWLMDGAAVLGLG